MKRLSLLLSTCAIAATSHAQLQSPSIVHNPINGNVEYSSLKSEIKQMRADRHAATASKGTAATSRWYSYVDYYDTTEADNSSQITLSAPYIWGDSSARFAYSGTSGIVYEFNKMVNMGTVLDPTYTGFNNPLYYPDEMQITSTSAYQLDSLIIWGIYGHNMTKLNVKDTLRITIMSGNGGATSDIMNKSTTNATVLTRYGIAAGGDLKYMNMAFDSTKNWAKGVTTYRKDIILDTSVWGDTTASGAWVSVVGFTPISIPPGNVVSATFQFISGDPAFTFGDTVFSSTMGYKYNAIRPYVAYKGTSAAPAFAPYSATNKNEGVFKNLPNSSNGWNDLFVPMWFWSSGTSGSTLQFPYIDYHLTCPTCTTAVDHTSVEQLAITKANAYPDPTADELNITFKSSVSGNAVVTLTNIVGQTVRTQSAKAVNGQTSKVTFSTSDLANGVYIYNVKVDGQTSTGRVVVSH
jgi:hypothetical protein